MGREDRRGNRKSREQSRKRRVPELGYYYIVTDTDQTEKNYLEGLRDSIPEKLRGKIVIKVTKSRTVDLVKTCKEGASLYPQYSEPWIILDRDQVKDFDSIVRNAQQNEIHAGWSNPCLEIWLHAYFGSMPNIQDSVSCCNKFATEYERRIGQKYDKAEKDLYKKLCEFGNEENAIKIAQQKRKQCIENGLSVPSKMIPCTMVDELIKEIRQKSQE
ncbi:RloB family protein [Longibaculum muris]|uniref:RloB family protein n=1 Tax=Longibaculum muris TaxID=1796628 RepID=UPI0022E0C34A|nr:RloB family protein [Longibaculum muris]